MSMTVEQLLQRLKDNDKYLAVGALHDDFSQVSKLPDVTEHKVTVFQSNGDTAKVENIRIQVYKKGQYEQIEDTENPGQFSNGALLEKAYFCEHGEPEAIKGNLEERFAEGIQKLLSVTGGKAWRKIELNTQRGYCDVKVFIENVAPNESGYNGTGEWKYFTVIQRGTEFDIYATDALLAKKPDVKK